MNLEICVDSVESARAAESGGAQRVELCSALSEGGITPSSGLIAAACEALSIPVFVMIRPRAGDFFYSAEEFSLMKRDIDAAKALGAAGVVLGVLLKNGEVDVERTRELTDLSRPLGVTFHRAIDWAPSMDDALEQVIAAGVDRILTSGGRQTALQGAENIARIVASAGDRIAVMVCGHVRAENIVELEQRTKASEFHASLRKMVRSPVTYQNQGLSLGEPGVDEFARYTVTVEDVRDLREAMLQTQVSK
jgi:copper homeostasis protein